MKKDEISQDYILEKHHSDPVQMKRVNSLQRSSAAAKQKYRLPEIILQFIMKTTKEQRKTFDDKHNSDSNIGAAVSKLKLSKSLIKKFNKQQCLICQSEVSSDQLMSISTCNHRFCASCIQQYIIFKVNTFEEVLCPQEQCNLTINIQGKAYSELPLQVRKKLKKNMQYQISKQQGKRICPNQNCQGVLDLTEKFFQPVCPDCKKTFCNRCFFQMHEGECDPHQLNFFQDTLHYRQCKKCKNVIEKTTGCNHITCKCGYQFCYLCGQKWHSSHVCKNPQNQNIPQQVTCSICCFDCQCNACVNCQCCENCECCECCENCECCECCAGQGICQTLLTCIRRFFVFWLWIIAILPLLWFIAFFGFILWFILSVIIGIFGYSFAVLEDLQGPLFFLAIIFFPITIFVGIFRSLQEVFCTVVSNQICNICCLPFEIIRQICQ